PGPLLVLPLLQFPVTRVRVAARVTNGDPLQLVPALRSEVQSLDKDLPFSAPQPLSRVASASLGQRRFQMTLLSIFALVALALAALGIYGVMAYSVAQRSREIGIRMALGASSSLVLRMILAGGVRLAVAAVALGRPGALVGTRVLASLLYRASAPHPPEPAATAAVRH